MVRVHQAYSHQAIPPQWQLICSRRSAWPLSRRASVSPPDILSGAFWIEAQKTLCVLIWRGKRTHLWNHQDRKGKATISGMERLPCRLQGGEEQRTVHFRQLWVSPAVLMTAKLLKVGIATYTRTSCCCYIFSTVWFKILRFPQQQILQDCRIYTPSHCINTVLFNEAAKSILVLVTAFKTTFLRQNLYQSTGVTFLPLACSG